MKEVPHSVLESFIQGLIAAAIETFNRKRDREKAKKEKLSGTDTTIIPRGEKRE